MRRFTAAKNYKKLFILAIIFACLLAVIPIMGFVISKPNDALLKVEYVKGYGEEKIVQKYSKGQKIIFPEEPTKNGYKFVGWAFNQDDDNLLTQEIYIDKEITLYAKWEKKNYFLNYNGETFKLSYESEFILEDDRLKIKTGEIIEEILEPVKLGFEFVKFIITDGKEQFDINEFSFDKIDGVEINLQAIFKEELINFNIEENSLFKIYNLSHQHKISVFEKLSFEIELNESVNQSNIEVKTSSGNVKAIKHNERYLIEITNFNQDFVVVVNNIKLNEYSIIFNNEGEKVEKTFNYGQNLIIPNIEKGGFKLVGFKDEKGRYYYNDYIVHSNLELFAVWEEEFYKVIFPRTNGMFIVSYEGETLTTSKEVIKKYNDDLSFSIKLSNAYNNSNIEVYGKTKFGNIEFNFVDGVYSLDLIYSDIEIVIDNIVLNSYSVTIDGTNYGDFGYGSWLYVDGDKILIRNIETNEEIEVKTLINDDFFGGWICNNQILVNCIVQDVADNNSNIEIEGSYSKKVAKIKLVPNGGSLDEIELIIVEGQEINLPNPTRFGYQFAGWFVKLIEVNTIVDKSLSVEFNEIDGIYMILYAGWTK